MTEHTGQDRHSFPRLPQLPAVSGRLVLWEYVHSSLGSSWARLFLNQIRQAASLAGMGTTLLANQSVFVATFGELHAVIENHPASFVFAEVSVAHYRELLGRIPQLRRMMPRLHIAVVCFELSGLTVGEYNVIDSLFHEAGVTAVLATQRELHAMIPVVLKHFVDLPPSETGWRESIEQRLPWRNIMTLPPETRL